jgi:hypothetical protein
MGWVVSATPRPLYPPVKTRYPLYRRLGGPQGRYGRLRKILLPTGIRSPDRPARSEFLYRLSYPGPHVLKGVTRSSGIWRRVICLTATNISDGWKESNKMLHCLKISSISFAVSEWVTWLMWLPMTSQLYCHGSNRDCVLCEVHVEVE